VITEFVLDLFLGVFLGFLDLLPVFDPDQLDAITQGTTNMWGMVWQSSAWLPMGWMIPGMLLLVSMRGLVLLYRSFHHVWKALPFT